MNFINRPENPPRNVTHKVFYSKVYSRDIGFNIYLPPEYHQSDEKYPVAYHLHGWTGNESSEIGTMEKIYANRRSITVFPNSSPVIEAYDSLPVESMIMDDLIPYIDAEYRTESGADSRSVSGFSMGGGMAFYYAARHPALFSSVTAYAGTYHHYYNRGFSTVGAAPDMARALYEDMMREERYLEENNILCIVRQNADLIRGRLRVTIHVGTDDILFCDNEILHLYLEALNIPHEYTLFQGVGHELQGIL